MNAMIGCRCHRRLETNEHRLYFTRIGKRKKDYIVGPFGFSNSPQESVNLLGFLRWFSVSLSSLEDVFRLSRVIVFAPSAVADSCSPFSPSLSLSTATHGSLSLHARLASLLAISVRSGLRFCDLLGFRFNMLKHGADSSKAKKRWKLSSKL
ncbi:uncharacterized protein LOC103986985 isoform X2 [Musa acuminata AAA Group]|uniref:uncharacterized protein LOC103986985 isoform X2 n=1 Tax=Musa acuminata AAA Group TaxID=214697 RepID=UPI0031D87789